MKVSVFCALIFIVNLGVDAQSSNYKKIMAERGVNGSKVFFSQLKEYQSINKEYGNVYFQLGKIELTNFAVLDPIVDRIASRQYVYNSKTNFSLAKNFLDEKDITKNPTWYDVPDIKDKDSIVSMTNNLIDQQYQATIDYAEAYEKLIFHYDNAVSHYLKAREDFITINTSADNLRQLFLQTDDSLKQAIKEVGVSFDSSMYHLDIYRDTYQLLPHAKKRKVIVNLNKIDHFRMNGITPTNFLADYIEVWDYKHWSEDFLNLIKIEVDGLQEEIKTAYEFFKATNDRMINGEECLQANIDDRKFQRIINLVTKYDNQSVLIDIFHYLLSKLEYGNQLIYERNCNPSNNPPTDDFISRKARVFQNLFTTFLDTDSVNRSIVTSGRQQGSFSWFFEEMMTGETGSVDFADQQRDENKQAFKNEVMKISELSNKQKFESDSIYQYFTREDSLLRERRIFGLDSLVVSKRIALSDSVDYLIANTGDELKILGAKQSGQDYIILWEQSAANNSDIQFYKTVSDSSFVIGGNSWIKHISTSGLEKNSIKLKSSDTVVYVSYNELQGSFQIIQSNGKKHVLTTVDFNGRTSSKEPFELPGKFLNMWRQDQSTWFFTSSLDEEGNSMINASILSNETNEFSEEINYQFSYQLVDPLLIKNDNESITLLAKNNDNEEEIIYSLMDYLGSIQYEQIF
jgi:hypothetical protein